MKKFYCLLLKGSNGILTGLMALLGFSACDKYGRTEYGTPYADYVVKGTVVNKSTSRPVQGIEVKVIDHDRSEWKGLTTQEGSFYLSKSNVFFDDSQKMSVIATDIDGEANGLFKPDTVYVYFHDAQQTVVGKGWFEGEHTLTVEFELEPDETNEPGE